MTWNRSHHARTNQKNPEGPSATRKQIQNKQVKAKPHPLWTANDIDRHSVVIV